MKLVFLANRLKQVFKSEFTLVQLIELQNIVNLAEAIQKAEASEYRSIEKASLKPYYSLSSAQQRLYFLYEFDKASLAYNLPQVVELEGELDKDRVEETFRRLINRHESLRTSIVTVGDETVQEILDEVGFSVEYSEAKESESESIIQEFIRPFDLRKAPLIRAGLIKVSEGSHLLMVDMHHIITDGVSQGVLIRDFMALYNCEELQEVHLHYKDYTEWQQGAEQQERLAAHRDFWKQEFSEELTPLELPVDYARPQVKNFAGSNTSFSLSKEESRKLKAVGAEAGANDVYDSTVCVQCAVE